MFLSPQHEHRVSTPSRLCAFSAGDYRGRGVALALGRTLKKLLQTGVFYPRDSNRLQNGPHSSIHKLLRLNCFTIKRMQGHIVWLWIYPCRACAHMFAQVDPHEHIGASSFAYVLTFREGPMSACAYVRTYTYLQAGTINFPTDGNVPRSRLAENASFFPLRDAEQRRARKKPSKTKKVNVLRREN